MLGDFSCRIALQVLGYVYPGYKTYKVINLPATRSNDTLLRHWCQYWTLMAVFTAAQPLLDTFVFWVPLYYEFKLAFAIYLWANDLAGTQYIWGRWFQPLISAYEPVVDQRLAESKAMAGDWLHSNSMRLVAVAQARVLSWLAQLQLQAQQAAGGGGGSGAAGGAVEQAAGGGGGRRRAGATTRSGKQRGDRHAYSSGEGEAEDLEEESEEEEVVIERKASKGRSKAAGGSKKAAAGAAGPAAGASSTAAMGSSLLPGGKDEAAVPPPGPSSRFSSFRLASFYSARSSDLQADDVKAGLKGFPVVYGSKDE